MRSILVLGLVAVLAVAAVESLECPQCINILSDCNDTTPTPCPDDSQSCGVTVASWPGDFSQTDQFCSAEPPGSSLNFAVRATDEELFLFANENCGEAETCTPTLAEDFPKVGNGDTECPACFALNGDSCEVRNETCGEGERCVDLRAQFNVRSTIEATLNSVIPLQLELKGCSNISDAACIRLSEGNTTVGNITFQHLVCTPEPTRTPDSSTTATPSTTSTPRTTATPRTTSTPSTTSNSSSSSNTTATPRTTSNSSSNTTTFPTTTDSSGLSQAAKLPWIASLVLGLLLL